MNLRAITSVVTPYLLLCAHLTFGAVPPVGDAATDCDLWRDSARSSPAHKCPSISLEDSEHAFSWEVNSEKTVFLVLYDAFGRQKFSKVYLTGETKDGMLSANDPKGKIPPGIYLIKGSSDQAIHAKKIVLTSAKD